MIIKEDDDKKKPMMVIVKYNKDGYEYHSYKGQQQTIKKKLKEIKELYGVQNAVYCSYEPNPTTFMSAMKKNKGLKFHYTHFNLNKINHNNLEEFLDKINNNRKEN